MPDGTAAQQVNKLFERVQNLSDHSVMSQIRERKQRRLHIKELLSKKIRELDLTWEQVFHVGSDVLVKFTGETNRPTWPAQVTAIHDGGFQVKWTQTTKMPRNQKIGMLYNVPATREKHLYR